MGQSLEELKVDLKIALIQHCRLNQRVEPTEIADDLSLFADGLGLDSIDLLELVVHLERTYGLKIRNNAEGREVLQTVHSMAQAIVNFEAKP